MGKGLFDYAAQNPAQDAPQVQEAITDTANAYQLAQERAQQALQLKEGIAQQIREGNAPQYILYAAVEAIGLLTNDAAWTQAQQEQLNKVYADLAQQSFIVNNEAIAAARLEKMQKDYNKRLRAQLAKQLQGYRQITAGLTDALRALDNIDPQDPEELLNR